MRRRIKIARKLDAPGQGVVSAAPQWPLDEPSVRDLAERPQVSTAGKQGAPNRVRAPPRTLKLLTVQEGADCARVSTQTVRRWIKAGELKIYRAGRQIRIDESDLIRLLTPQ